MNKRTNVISLVDSDDEQIDLNATSVMNAVNPPLKSFSSVSSATDVFNEIRTRVGVIMSTARQESCSMQMLQLVASLDGYVLQIMKEQSLKCTSSSSTALQANHTTQASVTPAVTTSQTSAPLREEDRPAKRKRVEQMEQVERVEDVLDASVVKFLQDEEAEEERKRMERDHNIALMFKPRSCPICIEDVDVDFIIKLTSCGHEFCRECITTYTSDKITSKAFPILCPTPDCKKELVIYDMEMLLDQAMLHKYEDFSFSSAVEANPEVYSCCPTADCGYIFVWEKDDSPDFKCAKCKKRYCLNCRVDFHKDSTCEQYQLWRKENGQADDLFDQFVRGQKFKKCTKCNKWIEKASGCNHITCKCGHKFCYNCGENYPCKCGQDPHVQIEANRAAVAAAAAAARAPVRRGRPAAAPPPAPAPVYAPQHFPFAANPFPAQFAPPPQNPFGFPPAFGGAPQAPFAAVAFPPPFGNPPAPGGNNTPFRGFGNNGLPPW